ncbi:hypothetical protein BJV77DRAFT_1000150 [Russula vinacea]|nr:hypothetical protein BJV77DRAFT_1000150 [Russula vinacea]
MLSGDPITGRLNIQLNSTTRFGSCAFDLAERLVLGEVETIPLAISTLATRRPNLYFYGYGQFTLYAHEGRSLVHFDGSIRTPAEIVVPDQALEVIRRVANGEYQNGSGTWKKVPINVLAVVQTPLPLVVHYLRTKDIEEWRLLRIFADVIGEVVQSIVQAVAAPASFAATFTTNWLEPSAMGTLGSATVCERLACTTQLAILCFGKAVIDLEARDNMIEVAVRLFKDAADAHESFRSRPVDLMTFLTQPVQTVFDRRDHQPIRQELQKLLNPRPENIALVIAQGALALMVKSNAQAVLNLAKEAPEEWMRVLLQDGNIPRVLQA